jgi:hypothetical protein
MRSIEDLRGREFIHYQDESIIYVVGRGKDGKTDIHWKGEANTTVYRDGQIMDFFERTVWILL